MTVRNTICALLLVGVLHNGCKSENHIDKYDVQLGALKTLPDGFYAYRRGSLYLGDSTGERYKIWFGIDFLGAVKEIFKVEDFKYRNADKLATVKKYNIDTLQSIETIKKFVRLSKKFRFGHINIDKSIKISFSYKDGLAEQYVRPMNDSVQKMYTSKKDFRLLANGWFEYVDQ